jgi:hypothetical protein
VPNELSKEQLKRLARLGAQARIDELDAERRAILRAFPGLVGQGSRQAGGAEGGAAAQGAAPAKARRRRRKMSGEQKKAQSERMKKIWAERRKSRP